MCVKNICPKNLKFTVKKAQIRKMVVEIAAKLGIPKEKILQPIVGGYITVVDEYKIQNPASCGKGATIAKFIIEEGRIEISEPLITHWDKDVIYSILYHEMIHHYLEITAGLGYSHGLEFQNLLNKCKISRVVEDIWILLHDNCYSWGESDDSPNHETVMQILQIKATMQDLEEPEWAIEEYMAECIQGGHDCAISKIKEFYTYVETMKAI
jgi:hypothetical protein